MDFKSEVALEPEVPKIVIYYPAEEGDTLITLMWQHGEHAFTYQIGDQSPEWVEIPESVNMYVASALMTNWLDKWCEDNEQAYEKGVE